MNKQPIERLKRIVDFYKLNDENNYDYSDEVLISMRIALEEIERLNNIINELEKYLEKIIIDGGTRGSMTFWYRQIYDYLQELKGSVSNE